MRSGIGIFACIVSLVACGGGADKGQSPPPQTANSAPTAAQLIEASSQAIGSVAASWLPSSDDSTPPDQIRYEVHAGTEPAFTPSSDTLKARTTGSVSAQITSGLMAGQQIFLRVVALDAAGAISVSAPLAVRVSDTTASIAAGVRPRTLQANEVATVARDSITLAPGVVVPGVGQVLASAEGDGFLRIVNSVSGTTVQTRNAALSEVVSGARLYSSFSLSAVPGPVAAQGIQPGQRLGLDGSRSERELRLAWPANQLSLIQVQDSASGSPISRRRLDTAAERPGQGMRALSTSGANISASAARAEGGVGRWANLSAPHSVAILAGTSGSFTLQASIEHDDARGDGTRIPLSVCRLELEWSDLPRVAAPHISPVRSDATETLTFRDGPSTFARRISQDLSVDASGLSARAEPYTIRLRLHVDEAENRCESFLGRRLLGWKEELTVDVKLIVGTAPNFPQAEQKRLHFEGGFSVTSETTFTFDPVIESEFVIENSSLKLGRVAARGRASLGQQLSIVAMGAGRIDRTVALVAERRFIKVFVAAAVPVVIVGKFKVDVRLEGEATGRIEVSETLNTALEDLFYQIRYENGAWQQDKNLRPVFDLRLSGDGQAEARLKVSLLPHLDLTLYDAATARLVLEAQADSVAGLRGKVLAQNVSNAITLDADAWLERGHIDGLVNAYWAADFSVWDVRVLAEPRSLRVGDLSTYNRVEIMPPTPILGLPTLRAAIDMVAVHPFDSRAVRVLGTATEVPNPFANLWGPASFIKFAAWSRPLVVAAGNLGYEVVPAPTGAPASEVWVRFDRPGNYVVRLGGHSSLGGWARQIAEATVRVDDANGNSIPDYWETRFTLTGSGGEIAAADPDNDGRTNLQEWQSGTDPRLADSAITITQLLDDKAPRTGGIPAGGVTDDTQPTLVGTLKDPLPTGASVRIYDGDTLAGAAHVTQRNWSFTTPPLAPGNHLLRAQLVLPAPMVGLVSGTWALTVREDSRFPHTGITTSQCLGDVGNELVSCESATAIGLSGPEKQDGMRWQSTQYELVRRSDGGTFERSECVYDAVTGLVWEGKPPGNGFRGSEILHSALSPGEPAERSYPNADWYIFELNAMALCGFRDWRMPTAEELHGLVNYGAAEGQPLIDQDWFPHTKSIYWTSTRTGRLYLGLPSREFVDFSNGELQLLTLSLTEVQFAKAYVRAVRGRSPVTSGRFSQNPNQGEVLDNVTGLIWQRCSVGQIYSNGQCVGNALLFTHEEALKYAKSVDGWRLPNVKELRTIAMTGNPGTYSDLQEPPLFAGYGWTSTLWVQDPIKLIGGFRSHSAWLVCYGWCVGDVTVYPEANSHRSPVWLVR